MQLPLLLEPAELADMLQTPAQYPEFVIIEQCPLARFESGHIAGSQHVDFKALQWGQKPTPGALPDLAATCELLGQLGIDPNTHVICSDDEGGGWAGRLIWLLDSLGHSRYSYLNGGLQAWGDDGLPLTSEIALKSDKAPYPATKYLNAPSMDKDAVLAALRQQNLSIWDARSRAEYTGEKAISTRGGHIPGAVHYEWTTAMDKTRGLRLRPLDTIKAELADLGLTADQPIVTHCQSHHRSGLTYLLGKLLELPVRAFPGSWAEWGNDPATPVTTGEQP